jgi:hypothetical protein
VLVVKSVVKYLQNPILKARLSIILQEFLTTESTKGTKIKISENFVISVPFVVQKRTSSTATLITLKISFHLHEEEIEPRTTRTNAKGRRFF